MKERIKIICYSNETGKQLLSKSAGVDGVSVNSCDSEWRKKYCVPNKRCDRFWSQGTYWSDMELAELLKKPVSKLTKHDRTVKAHRFEEAAFKRCKKIEIIARY